MYDIPIAIRFYVKEISHIAATFTKRLTMSEAAEMKFSNLVGLVYILCQFFILDIQYIVNDKWYSWLSSTKDDMTFSTIMIYD